MLRVSCSRFLLSLCVYGSFVPRVLGIALYPLLLFCRGGVPLRSNICNQMLQRLQQSEAAVPVAVSSLHSPLASVFIIIPGVVQIVCDASEDELLTSEMLMSAM